VWWWWKCPNSYWWIKRCRGGTCFKGTWTSCVRAAFGCEYMCPKGIGTPLEVLLVWTWHLGSVIRCVYCVQCSKSKIHLPWRYVDKSCDGREYTPPKDIGTPLEVLLVQTWCLGTVIRCVCCVQCSKSKIRLLWRYVDESHDSCEYMPPKDIGTLLEVSLVQTWHLGTVIRCVCCVWCSKSKIHLLWRYMDKSHDGHEYMPPKDIGTPLEVSLVWTQYLWTVIRYICCVWCSESRDVGEAPVLKVHGQVVRWLLIYTSEGFGTPLQVSVIRTQHSWIVIRCVCCVWCGESSDVGEAPIWRYMDKSCDSSLWPWTYNSPWKV